MAQEISVKANIDECIRLLNCLEKNERKIRRRMLSQTGTAVKSKIKKSYGSMLEKRTGALYKSLKSRVVKAGNMAVVYPAAEKSKVRYGFVLAKGAEITAKDGNLLTFQVNGKWIRKKSVSIKPRDWVAEPAKRYLESAEYRKKLDLMMQKEIERAEKEKRR